MVNNNNVNNGNINVNSIQTQLMNTMVQYNRTNKKLGNLKHLYDDIQYKYEQLQLKCSHYESIMQFDNNSVKYYQINIIISVSFIITSVLHIAIQKTLPDLNNGNNNNYDYTFNNNHNNNTTVNDNNSKYLHTFKCIYTYVLNSYVILIHSSFNGSWV